MSQLCACSTIMPHFAPTGRLKSTVEVSIGQQRSVCAEWLVSRVPATAAKAQLLLDLAARQPQEGQYASWMLPLAATALLNAAPPAAPHLWLQVIPLMLALAFARTFHNVTNCTYPPPHHHIKFTAKHLHSNLVKTLRPGTYLKLVFLNFCK